MKKTLLAAAVALVATNTHAGIELYNQNGASVTLSGDAEVRYVKSTKEDANVEQQIHDADLGIAVRYAVNDELSVGGFWEIQGDTGTTTEDGPRMGDAYIALYHATLGTLKFGDTVNVLDDLGIQEDYYFGSYGVINNGEFDGDETVRWDYEKDGFYAAVAYRDNQRADSAETVADAKIGYDFGDVDMMMYYGIHGADDLSAVAFELTYSGLEAINLGLGYYDFEDFGSAFTFGADYSVEKWLFAMGVALEDLEASDDTDLHYFVNAGYDIAKNTTLYAEVAANTLDDSELGYALGAKIKF